MGHDVVTVADLNCSQDSDIDLLNLAQKQNRILITRDKDFGNRSQKIFKKHQNVKIGNLRFCMRCGTNGVWKTKTQL